MLSPYYRTLRGFIDLVEKDWLQFGHKFSQRTGVFDERHNDSEKSPIFIQYLDCLRQILLQYPDAFEFNENLLLFIAQQMYTGKYGTFLGDNEREREQMRLHERTASIWTVVLQEQEKFINKNYQAVDEPIARIPETEYTKLVEWRQYFNQWSAFGKTFPLKEQAHHILSTFSGLNDFLHHVKGEKSYHSTMLAPFGNGVKPKLPPHLLRAMIPAEFIEFNFF